MGLASGAEAVTAEGDLVRAALNYLKALGIESWRNNTGMLYNRAGTPVRYGYAGSGDIFAIISGGRFCSIECKVGKNKESDAQKEFKRDVLAAGGLAVVIRSLDDLEEALWIHRGKASNEQARAKTVGQAGTAKPADP